jgi:CDP-paratose 2-epimerase
MSVALISGSLGLIGAEAALYFGRLGFDVVGADNDMRRQFFGDSHSTAPNQARLRGALGSRYTHHDLDIRDRKGVDSLIAHYGSSLALVIHTAAQPSHDWAARDPFTDFDVNAGGTLSLLEAVRRHSPGAVFIFTSTNKVYGDAPNRLPIVELETRFEIPQDHAYWNGIREDMSIDDCLHSLFGVSKASADLLVQEYGRYFGLHTACFRGGTLTGPHHAAAPLHGFLAYLMRCVVSREPYNVIGYKGKQVRDVIHSHDLVRAFDAFFRRPRCAAVYNIGGGRFSNCSVLEAIELCQEVAGVELRWTYREDPRIGDHIWWISSLERFEQDYPEWRPKYGLREIARQIHDAQVHA